MTTLERWINRNGTEEEDEHSIFAAFLLAGARSPDLETLALLVEWANVIEDLTTVASLELRAADVPWADIWAALGLTAEEGRRRHGSTSRRRAAARLSEADREHLSTRRPPGTPG